MLSQTTSEWLTLGQPGQPQSFRWVKVGWVGNFVCLATIGYQAKFAKFKRQNG